MENSTLQKLKDKKQYKQILSELETIPEKDQTITHIYYKLFALNRVQKFDNTISCMESHLSELEELNPIDQLNYYFEYLRALYRKGNYQQAKEVISDLMQLIETIDFESLTKAQQRSYASSFNHAGIIYFALRDFDKAMEFYGQLLPFGKRIPDNHVTSVALINIALIHSKHGQYSSAIENYNKALQLDNIKDETRLTIYNNLCSLYIMIGELDKGNEFCQLGIEMAEKGEDFVMLAKLLTNRADLKRKEGHLLRAKEDILEALEYKKKVGDPHEIIITLKSLVEINLALDQRQEAMTFLKQLRDLENEVESDTVKITYLMAEAIYLKSSSYFKHQLKAEEQLRTVIKSTKDAMTKIIAAVHLIELLLSDLSNDTPLLEDERDEMQSEVMNLYRDIIDTPEVVDTPIIQLQIHYIRAYLHLFFLQPDLVEHELKKATEIVEKTGLQVVNIDQPPMTLISKSVRPVLQQSLNKIIHAEPRLKIILALLDNPKLIFTELQELVNLTPGNLGRHCDKLVEAGYIDKSKEVINDKFLTVYSLTPEGLSEFRRYKNILETQLYN